MRRDGEFVGVGGREGGICDVHFIQRKSGFLRGFCGDFEGIFVVGGGDFCCGGRLPAPVSSLAGLGAGRDLLVAWNEWYL